ncbi:transient receptor potential-gamma protein-like isoform X2 [Amphibalanus amphitrite]|uniref:transient receptor potential-gamma protein-like isoform X2 n=1 Tax=Amphibalanus amphitrite TaxID=1232801 RepID=UPI001C919E7A|nr:transient receptor potential-gamma protein-like isoform X2 [Amphibalanus amphitrite]
MREPLANHGGSEPTALAETEVTAAQDVRPHQQMASLTLEEKRFLLAVERGDVATTRRLLQRTQNCTPTLNINCVDPLGRTALLMAIDNENLEMVELLIENKVETKDALLHAINEEYVEAVEVLLEHEELIHRPGELHSWEALPADTATFTPDITPLILAAHRDNYEIIKILMDRGASLPTPHSCRCGCEECMTSHQEDSLRHSRSRINSYRALASPSLIALSSKDPILQAFELSWELRRLSVLEHEFKTDYQELRKRCQDFATALLDHTRSSYELEVLLNHDPTGPAFEHGERMHLSRLKLAIKYKQKKFVAHPNVQQLLASIWYEGLPGFRRKNMLLQMIEVIRIGVLFPFFSFCYIIAPHSRMGRTMRRPFIKFICHSASYLTFLVLLILASQRIETVVSDWFGMPHNQNDVTTKRGARPSMVEWLILAWVAGLIWSEIKQLWDIGLQDYVSDLWNVIDFVTNALYVATIALRLVAYNQVQKELAENTGTANMPRECWDAWDPMLIAEGLFAAANIFSSLKLVYIFSINPHLGPLQVTLSRMVLDILKFAFLFMLTLFAFSCGLNQLLWYYADLEKQKCFSLRCHGDQGTCVKQEKDPDACFVWRRFSNLFETMQTLFWAVFGLIDLDNFELAGLKTFTRFWGMLMFGCYSTINITILLNLFIAMMNHSYQLISVSSSTLGTRATKSSSSGIEERADTEWKFARSKLWMSYFEEGGTVPPPFNIIITPKSVYYMFRWMVRKCCGHSYAARKEHMRTVRNSMLEERVFVTIMRNLVRRYVTREQRKADNQGVTEDDVNEIKQDISAFRCELVEILRNSGMNTSSANPGTGSGGKKNRLKERRLMKGFNLGSMHPPAGGAGAAGRRESALSATFTSALTPSALPTAGSLEAAREAGARSPAFRLSRFARVAEQRLAKREMSKRRWGTLVEAAKNARVAKLLTRSRSEDSSCSSSGERRSSRRQQSVDSDASGGSLRRREVPQPRPVPSLTLDLNTSAASGDEPRAGSPGRNSFVFIDDHPADDSTRQTSIESRASAGSSPRLLATHTASPEASVAPSSSREPLMVPPGGRFPNLPGIQPITRQMSQGWL